jgi:hypothetical protein
MALVKCSECGREVSTASVTCPNCGYPIRSSSSINPSSPIKPSSPLTPSSSRRSFFFWQGMEEHEKEGAIYILGTIGLVVLILILASLTHVIL